MEDMKVFIYFMIARFADFQVSQFGYSCWRLVKKTKRTTRLMVSSALFNLLPAFHALHGVNSESFLCRSLEWEH
jgi:hypothetical protein